MNLSSKLLQVDYDPEVLNAVRDGLCQPVKTLPSWLFYDETGDKIFQEIMNMLEYYLTASELEILQDCKQSMVDWFVGQTQRAPFNLVELGAGDGSKVEGLLLHLLNQWHNFTYMPIDVSSHVLEKLTSRLKQAMPSLQVKANNNLYHVALQEISAQDNTKKIILFLGSSIGNFSFEASLQFMKDVVQNMGSNDLMMIGFDLKKDPRLIRAAYDDKGGLTKKFNINLLHRLNRELGAQFRTDYFEHYATYEPEVGLAKSYLVSKKQQEVFVEAFNKSITFSQWETIHTEVSQKYDISMIHNLAQAAHLKVVDVFYDDKRYFCNVILQCK